MAGISGVSSQINMYGPIASGKRINSAADDAAGLTIAEKMNSQETGLRVGSDNAKDGVGLLNVADGALGQINDSLQRIYELGVKASNGLNTGEELGAIQKEIDHLLSDIEGIGKNTEFNTLKILDGSMADIDLATKPDGTGQKIRMVNSTLEELGIDGFDVTKKFDLNKITDAISKVSEARSGMGAQTNALESAIRYNDYAAENTLSSRSRLEDLDMAKAVSEKKKQETLNQYQMMMQKMDMNNHSNNMLQLMRF
ncbi:MAG: flagellin FliC5 [Lachnospiraceae bacterium]|nr:flagellin FliC5 [Lachnospiraceae bacterium]